MVAKRSSRSFNETKSVKNLAVKPLKANQAKSIKGGCADGKHLQLLPAVQKTL